MNWIDEPMESYVSHPNIGSGLFKKILKTPKDFHYARLFKKPSTPAQKLGTTVHELFEDVEKFDSKYVLQPEDWGPLTKNPAAKMWREFKEKAAAEGKTPLPWAQCEFIAKLRTEIKNHAAVKEVTHGCYKEKSCYAEYRGVPIKSRFDLYNPKTKTCWDIKTTSKDVDPDSLEMTILHNGYHFSMAHHMACMREIGVDVRSWGWIFVDTQSDAPHIVLVEADEEMLGLSRKTFEIAIDIYLKCAESDSWPGYGEDIQEIGFSDYSKRRFFGISQ